MKPTRANQPDRPSFRYGAVAPQPAVNWGQWNIRNLMTWFATYDPNFYVKCGGNINLYGGSASFGPTYIDPYGNVGGQVTAPLEILQLQDAAKAVPYAVTHESETVQHEQALGLGYKPQMNYTGNPSYFVPFWTLGTDMALVAQAIELGVPLEAVWGSMMSIGYPEVVAADFYCEILSSYTSQFDSQGDQRTAAADLGFGSARSIRDPIWFIAPGYTQAQQTKILKDQPQATFVTAPAGTLVNSMYSGAPWAYHIGGELCWIALPWADSDSESIYSLINAAALTYFDGQAAAILYGIGNNFDNMIQNLLPPYSQKLKTWVLSEQAKWQVPYSLVDFISPYPMSAENKAKLVESRFYNQFSIHPPTFIGAFADAILSGQSPWVANGGETVNYENQTSYYGLDTGFEQRVIAAWAHSTHLWLAASKLPVIPYGSLLKPFADLYDPDGVKAGS